MKHKAKFHWVSAVQEYHCICINCGERLFPQETITFPVDGDCTWTETLGINVKESVGVKDRFGGADG